MLWLASLYLYLLSGRYLDIYFCTAQRLIFIISVAPGSNQDIEEHFVTLGSDLPLKCGVISPKEEVVVWKWSESMDRKSDRVLSVGKMLVRNDGKGERKNIYLLL